ncbi:MAG: hypothetical protein M9894_36700 [Planctomycetes bacterium]|nr:hypothetical protein [Planctomycetota bacterium]
MLPPPLFLVQLSPDGPPPRVGQRVRWPGDDRVWVWDGEAWVGERTLFDGGDLWEDEEERPAA